MRPNNARSIKSCQVAIVIAFATAFQVPCHGQTNVTESADTTMIQEDLSRILGVKDAALERADQVYAETVEAVDKRYAQSLLLAQTLWSERISDSKAEAVSDLKALSSRLAAAGQLGDMIQVLKAMYGLTRQDPQVAQALVAAGVDLASIAPETNYFASREGKQASRIVLWNTHNSRFNTSGTLQCNVILYQGCTPVWRKDGVTLPWERNNDTSAVINVPALEFNIVRVEILKWKGYSGGLTEIEVWQGGKNIALHSPTRASAAVDRKTLSSKVTDGVTTSTAYKNGYWLLPKNQAGWIEVSLIRPVYHRVRRAKILARKPWQQVLEVSEGDILDITAHGNWRASPRIIAGPNGGLGPGGDQHGKYSDRFYLQGRLEGEVFKVGSKFTLHVPKDGFLELGMNEEDIAWFANNSGLIDVTLCIRKGSLLTPNDDEARASLVSKAGQDLPGNL